MKPSVTLQSVGTEDLQRLDEVLNTFVRETQVSCALLLDRTGRLLTTAGDVGGLDGTSFASLAAADFSASDQLAVLLGEQEFSALYHAGDKNSMYLADVGSGAAVLAAMFDGRTTLGMVRLKSKTMLPQLSALFTELVERPQAKSTLDSSWLSDAVDSVDRLFHE